MSASEKLRALALHADESHWRPQIDETLLHALPLIADCLEGAEGMIDSRFNPERWHWNRENLVAALKKLEETLQ